MLHHPGGGSDEVFAIVEKQEGGARLEVARDLIEDRGGIGTELRIAAATLTARQSEGLSDGTGDEVSVADRGQLHEPCPVWVISDALRGTLNRQPGLAGSADSGECEEAMVVESLHHIVEFDLTADERRRLNGQVVGMDVD